jgi:hypothetical protein
MFEKVWTKLRNVQTRKVAVQPSTHEKRAPPQCEQEQDVVMEQPPSEETLTKKSKSKSKRNSKTKEKSQKSSKASTSTTTTTTTTTAFERGDLSRGHFPSFEDIPTIRELQPQQQQQPPHDNEKVQAQQEKYATKEDQDVAVFLALAERMSVESLRFLLQGHVKETSGGSLPQRGTEQYAEIITTGVNANKTSPSGPGKKSRPASPSSPPCNDTNNKNTKSNNKIVNKKKCVKQFRFAEVSNHQVRQTVHLIENVSETPGLWWTNQEMKSIRNELIEMVQFVRRHKPDYIQDVETVAQQNQNELVLESHMKRLFQDHDYARGLESHIVELFTDHRKEFVTAVLDQQDECEAQTLDYDETSTSLREVALAYSHMPNRFAQRIARCDEINALKATMSSWRPKRAKE